MIQFDKHIFQMDWNHQLAYQNTVLIWYVVHDLHLITGASDEKKSQFCGPLVFEVWTVAMCFFF